MATHSAGGATWTPAYLAPEQITAQAPTPKIDVYAAGLILWELLAGRPATTLPHDPLAIEATLKAVATRKVDPLAALRPDIPEELALAIDAALVATPADRTITCAEIARRIRRVFHFAQGKMELRERVHAVRTATAGERDHAPSSEPAVPSQSSQSSISAARAPAALPGMLRRTLVGLAPPSAAVAIPAGDTTAAPATAALTALPVLPAAAALTPPPPPVRATAANVTAPTSMSASKIPLPVPPPHPAVSPFARTDMAAVSPFARTDISPMLAPATHRQVSPDPEEGTPSSDQVTTGVLQWSSLVNRLHAPTPWRRNTWLGAWVGLLLSLVALVGKLFFSRASSASVPPAPQVMSERPSVAQGTPPPSVEAPVPAEAPHETLPVAALTAEPAPSALPPSEEESMQLMKRRGLGYLTVHSSASRANVYINLKQVGALEERLSVPCGKRFVSIGISSGRPAKLVWLAPGKMMFIPCGAAFEATMNPRALR